MLSIRDHGSINSLITDQSTGRSKGFGFCYFSVRGQSKCLTLVYFFTLLYVCLLLDLGTFL